MGFWHALTHPFRRGPRRPLSYRQPKGETPATVPLGLEAIDMTAIENVNRRNAALERVSTFFAPVRSVQSFAEHAETRVDPFADDANYAARYHRAFNRKKVSD